MAFPFLSSQLFRVKQLALIFAAGSLVATSNLAAQIQYPIAPQPTASQAREPFFRYPRTRYQGFASLAPDEAFAITPPAQKDAVFRSDGSDFRSMSPDSWENPQGAFNPAQSPFKQPLATRLSNQDFQPNQIPSRQTSDAQFRANGQQPPIDQSFQPFPSDRNRQDSTDSNRQFKSTSHPLNKTQPEKTPAGDAMQSPMVPNDIRLPDELPERAFAPSSSLPGSNQQPLQQPSANPLPFGQDPASAVIEGNFPQQGTDQPLSSYPLGTVDLPLDPSRAWPSTRFVPEADRSIRQRGPELTPSVAPPVATAPPPVSPNQMTMEQHYQPQATFGYPTDQLLFQPKAPLPLTAPNFRPDLGHRAPNPVNRESDLNDYGQQFDFEKKYVEYPKIGEILSTGRYFGSATVNYLRPSFQANTSLFLNQSGITETFDFAYKLSPQFQLGFESKYGPGVELEYWSYSDISKLASFTSNGIETATTSAWMRGANQWARLTADNAGETLTARHRLELDVLGASFFKEVKLPKARINGKFGYQMAHIIHELVAQVTDSSGATVGTLRNRSDVRGYGPQFGLEYFRPIGHTKIEFLTTASGSVLFGKQSQVINNPTGLHQSRLKADEFIMTVDFFSGAQYRLLFGENRYYFVRAGMLYQAWLHGGTAVLPQDDFGLRGFAVTAGINR